MEQKKRRNGITIMAQLIGLVKPLFPIMCLAILLGVLGYLCAISLTILAGYGLLQGLFEASEFYALGKLAAILISLAILSFWKYFMPIRFLRLPLPFLLLL